ncbi:MAG: hypothetical protein LC114_18255 [Bryobacterales bacterium]|nr:hypothetical protein [Opitutaceae bacterium]MCZ2155814.1 hypothetical protein [Bryobacterales bacterium]
MTTNTRTFLRDFAAFKAQARKGGTVRVKDREGEFLFTASRTRKTLLGAARGRMLFRGDLTRPTLANDCWSPSA